MKKRNFFFKALVVFLTTGAFLFGDVSKVLTHPNKKMNNDEYDLFILGRSFFKIPWVEAPSATTARDGLGPLFNANTCHSCHPRNGRGAGRNSFGQLDRSVIVKLGRQALNSHEDKLVKTQGVMGDPTYGGQLQISSIADVPFEGRPRLEVKEYITVYPDGREVVLQKPVLSLQDLQYGKMHKDTSYTMRIAQSLIGMGLIDLIDERDILSYADEDDKDNDRISGKPNYVFSREYQKIVLGKFNWKASTPTVKEQTALAFHDDMGISNPLYPGSPCTKKQKECSKEPKSRYEFDITELRLEAVNFYVSNLKMPPSHIKEKEGQKLFKQVGCASCHRPSYTLATKDKIHPYSDFLLHDLGEELDDGVGNFRAEGSEWRTQPLWGLGTAQKILKKQPRYLHDGRARSLEEAILWHGGEALHVKMNFMDLPKAQRDKLINFLKEL